MKHFTRLAAATVLAAAPSVAMAQSGGTQSHSAAHGGSGTPSSMDQAMHSSMSKMQGMQKTGDPDHDFVMMMREHHQGAIDMSQAYLKEGKDPQIRKMAQKIINDQKKEISQFEAWERKHPAGAKK